MRSIQNFLAILVLLAATLLAGTSASTHAKTTESQSHPALSDPDSLRVIVDDIMAGFMDTLNIAGATVAVVKDGSLFFSGGYGLADVRRRVPVDPERTLFRIGSVTKPFTWIAVMQLRDAGKLDLDADINRYLDFTIPERFDRPVTLRHLLTHTPGFEDRLFGILGGPPRGGRAAWLERNIPARMWPPGEFAAYSNYGTALAGYIVERASGMSWEEYVETHIIAPIGMDYATTRQPVPERLEPFVSNGYKWKDKNFLRQEFERIEVQPSAGGMSASAEAMAAFMIALLPDETGSEVIESPAADASDPDEPAGALAAADVYASVSGTTPAPSSGVLHPETVREMLSTAFSPEPRTNGLGLGFMQLDSHGQRIFGHGGSTLLFHSDLFLLPEKRIGVFVSFNSEEGAFPGMSDFRLALLDRLYPDWIAERIRLPEEPSPGWDERAAALEGNYLVMRRPFSTFDKLLGVGMSMVSLKAQPDQPGTVTMDWLLGTDQLKEIEPGLFRDVDGHREMVLRGDPQLGYTHIFFSDLPMFAVEKESGTLSLTFRLMLLALCYAFFLTVPFAVFFRYLMQLFFGKPEALHGAELWYRRAGLAFALFSLAFPVLMVMAVADITSHFEASSKTMLRLVLLMPMASLPLAAVLIHGSVRALQNRLWSLSGRIHFVLVTLAALLFLSQLWYWNLIGWKF